MKNKTLTILFLIISITIFSCNCQKKCNKNEESNLVNPKTTKVLAPVIIYKTNGDFYQNVPVMLSDDKKEIVSFPDIKDVYYAGKLAYPTRLSNGYLLDNRGIGKNVAFLKYTYEEYSRLSSTPDADELFKMILNTDPLTELYKCDKLPKNDIQKLNEIIDGGLQNVCNRIK